MKDLGFQGKISKLISPSAYEGYQLARVIVEHKERYIVQTSTGILNAEITGNLRFTANSRLDFPAVGDWVKIAMMDAETAIIMEVFPRISVLERQTIGKKGEKQVIATNIDYAFLVQSVGHDFNLNRFERYIVLCKSADIKIIILLTKTDLISQKQVSEYLDLIEERIKNTPVIPLSIEDKESYNDLFNQFIPFKTYCFLGSSGVGKSTIINRLIGEELLKTNIISSSTNKGRHTTSLRQLIILPNKSIVIDTPGMREVGMTDNEGGIESTFSEIEELSDKCRFNDCRHENEEGCAVLKAVTDGQISYESVRNYHKLIREQEHFTSSVKDKRKKSRELGKMYKNILKEKKKYKG